MPILTGNARLFTQPDPTIQNGWNEHKTFWYSSNQLFIYTSGGCVTLNHRQETLLGFFRNMLQQKLSSQTLASLNYWIDLE